MNLDDALQKPCVADTSFLSNLVLTDNALLMRQVLNAPVNITPVVLDPLEPLGATFLKAEPLSEILRPLFFARQIKSKKNEGNEKYAQAEIPIQTFVNDKDKMWQPVVLTEDEQKFALEFRSPNIWKHYPEGTTRKRIGLDPGEAEALAVVVKRKWTLLADDQAAVDLAACLAPSPKVVRTCGFLVHAVNRGLLNCQQAERLFNDEICGKWGFYTKRSGSKQHLRFRCNPPQCKWEELI